MKEALYRKFGNFKDRATQFSIVTVTHWDQW